MFERVYFCQGEAAEPVLKVIDNEGAEHLLRSLAGEFHDSGHHETASEHFQSEDDDVLERDDYTLWWNSQSGYVGLHYRIEDVAKQT
jgi:hypothetical protein